MIINFSSNYLIRKFLGLPVRLFFWILDFMGPIQTMEKILYCRIKERENQRKTLIQNYQNSKFLIM